MARTLTCYSVKVEKEESERGSENTRKREGNVPENIEVLLLFL